MIVRITNRCRMGCRHCLIDGSGPGAGHMSMDTFRQALDLACRIGVHVLLLGGGEPFENPLVFDMLAAIDTINRTGSRRIVPVVISNGMFLEDEQMFRRVLGARLPLPVQVTNDPRYYPRRLQVPAGRLQHPAISFVDRVPTIQACRRTREAGIQADRRAPACFNLRSATRAVGLRDAVRMLECGTTGSVKVCTPSVDIDGTVVAGEADTCMRIGTVGSMVSDLDSALRSMSCARCGCIGNLAPVHRAAIGERPVAGEAAVGDGGDRG